MACIQLQAITNTNDEPFSIVPPEEISKEFYA